MSRYPTSSGTDLTVITVSLETNEGPFIAAQFAIADPHCVRT